MNFPNVITALTKAQNNFDYVAYANCFSEDAVVFDEGKNHKGKKAIQQWIKQANEAYQTTMKPLEYSESKKVLKAEVAGNFPGSPLILSYHFTFQNGLIESLNITA